MPFLEYSENGRRYYVPVVTPSGFDDFNSISTKKDSWYHVTYNKFQPQGLVAKDTQLYYDGQNVSSMVDSVALKNQKKNVEYELAEYLICNIKGKTYYINDIVRQFGDNYIDKLTVDAAGSIPYEVSDEPDGKYDPNLGIYFHGQTIKPSTPELTSNDKSIQGLIDNCKFLGLTDSYSPIVFGQHVVTCNTNIYDKYFADGSNGNDIATFTLRIIKPNSYCVIRKIEFDVDVSGHSGGVEGVNGSSVTDSIHGVTNDTSLNLDLDIEYLSLISNIAYLYFLGSYKDEYFMTLPKIKLAKHQEQVVEPSLPLNKIQQLQNSKYAKSSVMGTPYPSAAYPSTAYPSLTTMPVSGQPLTSSSSSNSAAMSTLMQSAKIGEPENLRHVSPKVFGTSVMPANTNKGRSQQLPTFVPQQFTIGPTDPSLYNFDLYSVHDFPQNYAPEESAEQQEQEYLDRVRGTKLGPSEPYPPNRLSEYRDY